MDRSPAPCKPLEESAASESTVQRLSSPWGEHSLHGDVGCSGGGGGRGPGLAAGCSSCSSPRPWGGWCPCVAFRRGRQAWGPEQQGQAGARVRGRPVSPSLGQGAGAQCRGRGPTGGPSREQGRNVSTRTCWKLLAGWSRAAAPRPVPLQPDGPPREDTGIGPTGSWDVRFSSLNQPQTWRRSRGVRGKLRGAGFRSAGCVWVGGGGKLGGYDPPPASPQVWFSCWGGRGQHLRHSAL